MEDLKLQTNEGVLKEEEGVVCQKKTFKLFLTHLNLITVEEKGFFKTKYIIEKHPLDQIKVIDGIAQVSAFLDEDGCSVLRVMFKHDKNLDFIFEDEQSLFSGFVKKKKVSEKVVAWAEQISQLLTGHKVYNNPQNKTKEVGLVGKIKGLLFGEQEEEKNEEEDKTFVSINCPGCGNLVSGLKGSAVECKYCGNKIAL